MSDPNSEVMAQLKALQTQIETLQASQAENDKKDALIAQLQSAASQRIIRQAGIVDGEDPYPALKAHLKTNNHPNTYIPITTGLVTCLDCGEIEALNPIGASRKNTEVM